MSTQRYISTSFWNDKWIRSLDPSERYLYMYLLTNPLTNIAGIYQITIDRIAFDTGYDQRTLLTMLERFAIAGKALFVLEEWIILPSWPKHQKWESKLTIKKGIESTLRTIPKVVLDEAKKANYLYPIDILPVPYPQEPSYLNSDTDIDIDTEFEETKIDTERKDVFIQEMKPITHCANTIYELFKKAELPMREKSSFEFSCGTFKNGLEHIRGKNITTDDLCAAVENYASLFMPNKKKTWYTNKANFETFCKNRITDFLPGNFIESNYYNGQEEPEVQKKETAKPESADSVLCSTHNKANGWYEDVWYFKDGVCPECACDRKVKAS